VYRYELGSTLSVYRSDLWCFENYNSVSVKRKKYLDIVRYQLLKENSAPPS
jgi:hypothetical protein